MERILDLIDSALKLETKEEALSVWLDESCINVGRQLLWGWFNPEDPETRCAAKRSKGLRIIILDAIVTRAGRLKQTLEVEAAEDQ